MLMMINIISNPIFSIKWNTVTYRFIVTIDKFDSFIRMFNLIGSDIVTYFPSLSQKKSCYSESLMHYIDNH